MADVAKRIRVTGRVQGVFYRNWTVEQARSLGVAGWVRNRRDGRVEILAAGEEEAVEALIGLCREGPPAAMVESVEVENSAEEAPSPFTKLPTA